MLANILCMENQRQSEVWAVKVASSKVRMNASSECTRRLRNATVRRFIVLY